MGKTWEYTYDAWGNCTETILNATGTNNYARSNPFRYRGYYLDTETRLYYLQSRYYDPAIGRFINPDGTEYLGANGDLISFNLYAYCSNNPVMYSGPAGNSIVAICIFIGVSAIIGGIAGVFTAKCTDANIVEGILEGIALGAVAAAATILIPTLLPQLSVAATTCLTFLAASSGGLAIDYVTQRISHKLGENSQKKFNLDEVRLYKTALATGIAGIVPTIGNPGASTINAISSLILGGDAALINASIDVILTNLLK